MIFLFPSLLKKKKILTLLFSILGLSLHNIFDTKFKDYDFLLLFCKISILYAESKISLEDKEKVAGRKRTPNISWAEAEF